MKIDISTLDGGSAGSVELDDAVFGLEPRADILQRCVRWQLAKRQAGTHAVKNRSDIDRTTKKVYALALKHALSAKVQDAALIVVDDAKLADPKTKALKDSFGKLGVTSA